MAVKRDSCFCQEHPEDHLLTRAQLDDYLRQAGWQGWWWPVGIGGKRPASGLKLLGLDPCSSAHPPMLHSLDADWELEPELELGLGLEPKVLQVSVEVSQKWVCRASWAPCVAVDWN